jgi:hypothetical protein
MQYIFIVLYVGENMYNKDIYLVASVGNFYL